MFTNEIININYGLLAIVFFQTLSNLKAFFILRSAQRKQGAGLELPDLSVLVSLRNEADHLENLIPALLSQKYPNFKLIFINDQSFDRSLEILRRFEEEFPEKIQVINIPLELKNSGKKFALSMGIKSAKTEWLVFTDADCIPSSENWLMGMMNSRVSLETSLVLGLSPYRRQHYLTNSLVQLETFFTAMDYSYSSLIGKPYMGVGRNLAYTKSLWMNNKGFSCHQHIRSGDDDLFIQEVANSKNTSICLKDNSHCLSEPPRSLKEWWNQKSRHYTTSAVYSIHTKFRLGLKHLLSLFNMLAILIMWLEWIWITPETQWMGQQISVLIMLLIQLFTLMGIRKVLGFPLRFSEIIFGRIPLYLLQFSILVFSRLTKPKNW